MKNIYECSFCDCYSAIRRRNKNTEKTICSIKVSMSIQFRDATDRHHVYGETHDPWMYVINYCPVCGRRIKK